ncbi:MAG: sugar phosphate nucleotidyltransferase [Candidatus Hydrothermarchaeales archaeon]
MGEIRVEFAARKEEMTRVNGSAAVERIESLPAPPSISSKMTGMILCGGKGRGLRPLTKDFPKVLLEFQDEYCALTKQLLDFKYCGIKEVVLLIGYYGREIKRACGKEFKGLNISYVDSKKGTLDAIREGLATIDEGDVIIRNGDVITDVNLKTMMESSFEPITIFVTPMQSPYGIVELGDTKILSFREKPTLGHFINGGTYLVKEHAFDLFEGYPSGDVERNVFPSLAREGKLGFYKEDRIFWRSLDTAKDWDAIKREYSNRVDKPWGFEKTLVSTEKYLTKELYIKGGYQTSYHHHTKKDETLSIDRGYGYVYFREGESQSFSAGDTLRVRPFTNHSIVATENTSITEVSTPHPKDTVRVKDFYDR